MKYRIYFKYPYLHNYAEMGKSFVLNFLMEENIFIFILYVKDFNYKKALYFHTKSLHIKASILNGYIQVLRRFFLPQICVNVRPIHIFIHLVFFLAQSRARHVSHFLSDFNHGYIKYAFWGSLSFGFSMVLLKLPYLAVLIVLGIGAVCCDTNSEQDSAEGNFRILSLYITLSVSVYLKQIFITQIW